MPDVFALIHAVKGSQALQCGEAINGEPNRDRWSDGEFVGHDLGPGWNRKATCRSQSANAARGIKARINSAQEEATTGKTRTPELVATGGIKGGQAPTHRMKVQQTIHKEGPAHAITEHHSPHQIQHRRLHHSSGLVYGADRCASCQDCYAWISKPQVAEEGLEEGAYPALDWGPRSVSNAWITSTSDLLRHIGFFLPHRCRVTSPAAPTAIAPGKLLPSDLLRCSLSLRALVISHPLCYGLDSGLRLAGGRWGQFWPVFVPVIGAHIDARYLPGAKRLDGLALGCGDRLFATAHL